MAKTPTCTHRNACAVRQNYLIDIGQTQIKKKKKRNKEKKEKIITHLSEKKLDIWVSICLRFPGIFLVSL